MAHTYRHSQFLGSIVESDSAYCDRYCKTLYFRCNLISRFWNLEISLHFNLAFSQFLLVFTKSLMGKLNFRGYLISRFYPTREIREI